MSTYEEDKRNSIQLMKYMSILNVKMGIAIQTLMTTKAEEMLSPLQDGTIDPGDKEQVIDHMMSLISSLAEYQALLQFGRANKEKIARMYRFYAEMAEENYDEIIKISQQGSMDGAVEGMFDMLLQMGVVTDKRPGPA